MELPEEDDARMTSEQLAELGEALSILSAKSSVLKERDELKAIMQENLVSEEVCLRLRSPVKNSLLTSLFFARKRTAKVHHPHKHYRSVSGA